MPEGRALALASDESARSVMRAVLVVTSASLLAMGALFLTFDPHEHRRIAILDLLAGSIVAGTLWTVWGRPLGRAATDRIVAAALILGILLEVSAAIGRDATGATAVLGLILAAAGGFLVRPGPLAAVAAATLAAWLTLRALAPAPGDLLTEGPILFAAAAIATIFQAARRGTERRLDAARAAEAARAIEGERQRAALSESEQRFRMIAEGVSEVFWLQEVGSKKLLYVSPSYRLTWGREPADLLAGAHTFLDTVHPADRDRVAGLAASQEEGTSESEYRIVRPDGTVRWIRDRAYVVPDGDVRRLVGVAEDVTERKSLEERYRTIFNDMPTPAWVYDFDTMRILDVNEAAVRHYGYPRERFLEMTLLDLRPREAVPTFLAQRAEVDPVGPRQIEAKHLKADGTVSDVIVTAANFESLGPRVAIAVCQDITELNRASEAARRNERLASLGTLVAGVAHEINNPLAYMRGNVELAQMDLDDVRAALLRKDLDQVWSSVAAASDKLGPILGGVDQIARITGSLKQAARKPLDRRAPTDLGDVVKAAIAVATPRMPPGTRMETDIAAVGADVVAGEVGQLVLNLILNAADAVASVEQPRIHVRLHAAGANAIVRVQDNGHGIPPGVRARIFTPFHTTKDRGTGLGLSTALAIARQHQGDLTFDTREGHGTTFTVTLPLRSGKAQAMA